MIGAIIGDIVGSRFEFNNLKDKDFDLFTSASFFTDDSLMTLAVASAILKYKNGQGNLRDLAIKNMQELGLRYFDVGFGQMFASWLASDIPVPYNSYGNGAAMRVSPCAYMASSLDEALFMGKVVTDITHNHPESIRAISALIEAIWVAKRHKSKRKIKNIILKKYNYDIPSIDAIRPSYRFDVTCKGTMPVAFAAFLESTSFEDAIRNAISVGGDSDTIAAITGALAEAYYGVPVELEKQALSMLPEDLFFICLAARYFCY